MAPTSSVVCLTSWATRLGLEAGTPVLAGGVDAAMATLAAGVTQPGNHVAMIGTSMCWGYLNQQVDARHGLVSMPHVYNGHRDLYIFGGAITAGASVSWFRRTVLPGRGTTGQGPRPGQPGTAGTERDEYSGGQRRGGVPALPDGRAQPGVGRPRQWQFVGLNLYHSRIHLYRAVLEGVSFALRHNIEAGTRGAHSLDPRLIVVGGASRSDLWMQIIADVTRLPVYTIVQEVEAALGAALLAAHAVGLVSDEAMDKGWVHLALRAEPKAQNAEVYDRVFAEYVKLYPALRPIMHNLQTT